MLCGWVSPTSLKSRFHGFKGCNIYKYENSQARDEGYYHTFVERNFYDEQKILQNCTNPQSARRYILENRCNGFPKIQYIQHDAVTIVVRGVLLKILSKYNQTTANQIAEQRNSLWNLSVNSFNRCTNGRIEFLNNPSTRNAPCSSRSDIFQ